MTEPPETDPPTVEETLVPESDVIISKVFFWSIAVIAVAAVVVGVVAYVLTRPKRAPTVDERPLVLPRTQERVAEIPGVQFVDVTEEAGIEFVHQNGARGEKLLPETMGGGCAFFDLDGDRDQDLLFVNSSFWPPDAPPDEQPTMALYENDGAGKFTDVTARCGLDVGFYGMGVAVGDYDNDGDEDIFLTAVGENRLLRNQAGRFEDVTRAAGVAGDPDSWSTSAGFFDYDDDGHLDLFVCNYVRWSRQIDAEVDYKLTGIGRAYGPPTNFEGAHSYLYHNRGDGSFEDVSSSAGIRVDNPATGQPMAKALGVVPVDADGDGWIDIVVANDTVQNFFFHNQGDGTFTEKGTDTGMAFDSNGLSTGAMGVDAAHFRNDDALGIGMGNFANEMTSLYVSQGESLLYADEAITEGIGPVSRQMLTFGLFFFDYDLDGRVDLLQVNGHLEEEIHVVQPSQKYRQPAQLFWNAGPQARHGFTPVDPATTGDLSRPIVGRGATYADMDSDGDLDVLLTQVGGKPLLLRNDQKLGHHWVRVRLVGKGSNRDGIGAWIRVTAGGRTQRRQVMPTRSYLSQVELPVTFGLGDATKIAALEVEWPDGSRTEVPAEQLGADREIVVERT